MTLTKAIVYAASMDAYQSAKRRGKSQDDCNDAYHAEFDRLFTAIGGPEGWMNLP
jgi:hypothetical protein